MQEVSQEIKDIDSELEAITQETNDMASRLPNLPHESVPVGALEEDSEEVKRWGDELLSRPGEEPQAHGDLGENLGILDFEHGAKVSQSRFVYYIGAGARLERALYNFMLDIQTEEHDYLETIPPYIVN
ncbi:serine--tRNA ligase, partial [Salmonella enterica subsp. enterica serovar Typhimurium]